MVIKYHLRQKEKIVTGRRVAWLPPYMYHLPQHRREPLGGPSSFSQGASWKVCAVELKPRVHFRKEQYEAMTTDGRVQGNNRFGKKRKRDSKSE